MCLRLPSPGGASRSTSRHPPAAREPRRSSHRNGADRRNDSVEAPIRAEGRSEHRDPLAFETTQRADNLQIELNRTIEDRPLFAASRDEAAADTSSLGPKSNHRGPSASRRRRELNRTIEDRPRLVVIRVQREQSRTGAGLRPWLGHFVSWRGLGAARLAWEVRPRGSACAVYSRHHR